MRIKFISLVLFFLPFSGFANTLIKVDVNDDGIVSPDEFKIFLQKIHEKPPSFFDKNKDGLLSPDELKEANTAVSKSLLQVDSLTDFYAADHKNESKPDGLSTKKFHQIYNSEKVKDILHIVYGKPKPKAKNKLLVRGKKENLVDFGDETNFKKASAAEFSYIDDRSNSNTVWSIKGIAMLPITLGEKEDFVFVPSLEVNRLSNAKNEDKEVDTLIFRSSLGWVGEHGNTDWYFSLSPTHTTDSDFDTNIKSIDLSVSPINTNFGFGGSMSVGESMLIRNSLSMNFDFGKIYNNGGNENLIEGEEFFRIGPAMKLEAWFYKNDRFKAEFNYGFYKKISGDLRSKKLFKAALEYKLNEKGNYVLKTSYTNGDTSNKLENEDTLAFGLGVKF